MRFVVLNPSIQKYKLRVLRDKPNENSIDKALVFDGRLFDTVKNIEWLMINDLGHFIMFCDLIFNESSFGKNGTFHVWLDGLYTF